MTKDVRVYLDDILESIAKIGAYTNEISFVGLTHFSVISSELSVRGRRGSREISQQIRPNGEIARFAPLRSLRSE
jgi:uncharacterized protein with HEPN domain